MGPRIDQRVHNNWADMVEKEYVDHTRSTRLARDIAKVQAQIDKLEEMVRSRHFRAFENADRETDIAEKELRKRLVALIAQSLGYWPMINISFLKDTKDSLPVYIIMNVNKSGEFSISVKPYDSNNRNHADNPKRGIPDPCYNQVDRPNDLDIEFDLYQDAINNLAKMSVEKHGWKNVRISAIPNGTAMPIGIREILVAAEGFFNNNCFIIYDAPVWEVNRIVHYFPQHAVLIGRKYGQWFFIAKYTTMNISEYIAQELASVKPEKKPTPVEKKE